MAKNVNTPSRSRALAAASYEVGYGKPPKATRFKPGQTGNPRGRPRGPSAPAPNPNDERMKAIVVDEAYRTIQVRDGDRAIEIPVIQAVVRSLALSAAKGHQRSQRLFTDLVRLVEQERRALHERFLEAAIEYKCDWERELERRERLGLDLPPPLPHPDDILVDVRSGQVRFMGPMTKEEAELFNLLRGSNGSGGENP
jgi:hypothetical protein